MGFEEVETKMKRRNSRRKGHSFERLVANLLKPLYPNARRHLEFQVGEANGVDISNTGSYKIQCKRLAKYAPVTCIEEVQCCEELGDVPVLITAGNEKRAVAVIPLEEFIRLVRVDLSRG